MNKTKTKKRSTSADHAKTHRELHANLDQLVADWIVHTGKIPSEGTVMELMIWSHEQTINPMEI